MTAPTPPKGMGFCPFGFAPFGYGSPATAGDNEGRTLQKTVNGSSGDARQIDPYTRDYNIDENGFIIGQSSIAQQVFLACITSIGSSANPTLGSQFRNLKTFNPSTFQSSVNVIIQKALSSLIKAGTISLVGVVASINSNGVCGNINVTWIDNTTSQQNQTVITT